MQNQTQPAGTQGSISNEYDSGVPLAFAYQQLNASVDFVAMFGQRLYEPVAIPPKNEAGDSFVIVKASGFDVALWAGLPEYIGFICSQVQVINVRKYPYGEATEMDFRQPIKIFRRAMCGFCGLDVNHDGEKIGEIWQAAFLREVPMTSFKDGTYDVLHKGIEVGLVWR